MQKNHPSTPLFTREAFLLSLSRQCLGCYSEQLRCTEKNLVRTKDGHSTTLVDYPVAICSNPSCGRVYAQQSRDGNRYGQGFMTGRTEVIFVETFPYHIPLGGKVSNILSEHQFCDPETVRPAHHLC